MVHTVVDLQAAVSGIVSLIVMTSLPGGDGEGHGLVDGTPPMGGRTAVAG